MGRDAQTRLLRSCAAEAAAGRGGLVIVHGPAGIGKSTLLRHALLGADLGLHLGMGWSAEGEGAPPLWPWQQAAEPLGDARLSAALEEVPDQAELSDAATASAARFRRLAAAARELGRVASDRPTAVVLEDLHWADAASLALLDHVAAAAARHPLLVVASSRDDGLAQRLGRYPSVTALALPPLSVTDVAALLRDSPDPGLDPDEIVELTGGLPLLVSAAARAVGDGPSRDVRVVAEALLGQVPESARRVLRDASLLDGAEPELLAAVGDTSLGQVLTAIEAGRRSGLLETPATAEGQRAVFAHALLRNGVRASVPLDRARAVHRAAAVHLGGRWQDEHLPGTTPATIAATVAAHWAQAGSDPEALRATAHWSLVAGRAATRGLAPEGAVRHLARAVAALTRLGTPDAELADALLALAEAQYLAGDYRAALTTCEEAARRGESAGRGDLVADAALVVRWVTFPQANDVLGRLASQALRMPGLPRATRARLLAQLATTHADAGHPDARDLATEALELAESDGDGLALVDAARARELTLTVHMVAEVEERLRLGELTVRHSTELGQPVGAVLGHEWRLRAGYELARPSVVEDALRAIGVLATRTALPLVRWHAARASAAVSGLEGRFAAARAANTEAHEIALATGDVTAAGLSTAHAHWLARVRGDAADIMPGTERQLEGLPHEPLIVAALGQLRLNAGRDVEARACYERLLPLLADPPSHDLRWAAVALELVELVLAFSDTATAAALLPHLEPFRAYPGIVGIPTVYFMGSPRRQIGQLLGLLGGPDEGAPLLREALAIDAGLGARPFVVLGRLDLAGVLLRRASAADRREARAATAAAAAEARRLDMPGPLARADRLLRDIDAAERAANPLSERETEVAALVRAALTNRQIADRLVISERTVESHVSAILRKAGVTSRTEYLARHGGAGEV